VSRYSKGGRHETDCRRHRVLDEVLATLENLQAVGACPVRRRRGRGKSQRSLELTDAARQILRRFILRRCARGLLSAVHRLQADPVDDGRHRAVRASSPMRATWASFRGVDRDETRAPERISAWDNLPDYLETVNARIAGTADTSPTD
jgi:hypothetical protein